MSVPWARRLFVAVFTDVPESRWRKVSQVGQRSSVPLESSEEGSLSTFVTVAPSQVK